MAQSRQTPRVWSDAIRGSEIPSNWGQAWHQRRAAVVLDRHRIRRCSGRVVVLRGHHPRSTENCGCSTFATASASAGGSPIFPIRTAVGRASKCRRTRSGATRGAATRSSAGDSKGACFSACFWPPLGPSRQVSSCATAAARPPKIGTSARRAWLPSRPWSSSPRPSCFSLDVRNLAWTLWGGVRET